MSPLRRLFLLRSLVFAGGIAVIAVGWLVLHVAQLQSQTALASSLPQQQDAQLLHAEIQTLSALFAQMAQTRSLGELDTLQDRIEAQWSAVQRTFLRASEADDAVSGAMTEQLRLIRRILDAATSTARAHRSDGAVSEDETYVEHNQAQALHLAAIRLATHASGMAADLNRQIQDQTRSARRLLIAQALTGFLIVAAIMVTLSWQYRLLDRRLIGRIEKLGEAASSGEVTRYLADSLVGVGDEIDAMHQKLHQLMVQNAEQKAHLEQLATTDSLTGLKNRRAVLELLRLQIALSQRGHPSPAVILLDIDFFKRINDTYGHSAGDQALVVISQILLDRVRDTDCVGRFGGEEFILVLPNTRQEGALALAEILRESIRSTAIEVRGFQPFFCTASFGVAVGHANTTDWEALVKRADAALYSAKESGRDCVGLG